MTADAIVVGAGIIGAAVADALATEGLGVIVVDERFPCAGTTGAAMGHMVAMDDSPAQLQLTSLSLRLFNTKRDELPPIEYDACGTLWIAEDAAQLEAGRGKAAQLNAAGVAAHIVDATELHALEPELRDGLAGAVLVPGDSVVYPPALCAALLAHVQVLRHKRVLRIEPGTVITDSGRLSARFIINATGAYAPRLTPGLPIQPKRGHLVITERHPSFCHHELVELGYMTSAHGHGTESVAFNVQPRSTGQLLIGSSRELIGFDTNINRGIVGRMLERAALFLPRIGRLTALRTWTGFRPSTPDNLPLIGPWDAIPGLWIAAGHEGLGITTAFGTARMLVDMMLERTPPIDVRPFAPQRMMAHA